MNEPPLFDISETDERIRQAVAKTLQQRAQKRAERVELKRNRDWGLAQRHGRKLMRNRQEKPLP